MQSKAFQYAHMQDWQQRPEMLNRSPSSSPPQQRAGLPPSPGRQLSSPGTDLESQGPSQDSPGVHAPLDQPAGIDSDDNFEVSDDADERQVHFASTAPSSLSSPPLSHQEQHVQSIPVQYTLNGCSKHLSPTCMCEWCS